MISPLELDNRAVPTEHMTSRQREVLRLVSEYYAGAREFPSSGWLARRLRIHRSTAHEHMQLVLGKLDPSRRRF